MPNIQVQLCIEASEAASLFERQWFDLAFRTLGGDMARLAVSRELPYLDDPAERAGTSSCYVALGEGEGQTRVYTEEAWQWLMDSLDSPGVMAGLSYFTYDDQGWPTYPTMVISTGPVGGDQDWVLLDFESSDDGLRDLEGQGRLRTMLRAVAERSNPSHGEISFVTSVGRAAWEAALNNYRSETIPRSREVARSFGWVTVLAAELAARLDVAGLAAGGAFVEVAELGGGGLWLRATEDWRAYDVAAAARVRAALAPVLPAKEPRYADPANMIPETDTTVPEIRMI